MRNDLLFKLGALSAVLLLTACGGGGSSSSSNTISVPTAAVQVTSTNASTVAGNANSSTQTMASNSKTANSTLGVASATQPTTSAHSILEITSTEFNRAISTKLPPASIAGTVASATYNCGTGTVATAGSPNSFTIAASYANGSSLSPGDSLTIAYTTCTFSGVTSTMNGSLTFAVTTLVGAAPSYSQAAYTVTFGNFSSVDSSLGASMFMSGGMTISASVSGTITTSTISGSSFSVSSTIGGTTNSFMLYGTNGFNETYIYDSSTTNYSYSANMAVASTAMGGSAVISTTTPFTGTGTGNPTAGSMTITGTNGSYVTLAANPDGTTVNLTGNDGTNNFSYTNIAWTSL